MRVFFYDEISALELTEELGIGDWYRRNFINVVASEDEPVFDDGATAK